MKAILLSLLVFVSCQCLASPTETLTGTLLVINKGSDSVDFIDVKSGKRITRLPTGKGPHEIAVSDDGKWAVSTDYVGGDSLTVIDVNARKVVRTIDLNQYGAPHGIRFLPDQKRVIVSSEKSNSVVIADIHTGKITQAISTKQPGSHMVAITTDGKRAVTPNMRANSLSIIDLQVGALIKTYPTEDKPEAIEINGDLNEIWYGANGPGTLNVMDLDSGETVKQWSGFTFPYRVLFSRDNQFAVVPDFMKDTLTIFSPTQKRKLQTIQLEDDAGPQGVMLHPNDRTLFLSLNTANQILAIDVASGDILRTYQAGENPDGIGFTPASFKTD